MIVAVAEVRITGDGVGDLRAEAEGVGVGIGAAERDQLAERVVLIAGGERAVARVDQLADIAATVERGQVIRAARGRATKRTNVGVLA